MLVLLIAYCTFNYDELRRTLLGEVSSSSTEKYYIGESDYFDNDEIDEGYDSDDVGGTLEEQEEYAGHIKYTVPELDERVRCYLSDNLNLGASGRISVFSTTDVNGNPSVVTVKVYLSDIALNSDNKQIIKSVISSAIGEDIDVLHDGLFNTYYHYGYPINSLDLQFTDTFGNIILQSTGGLKGYTDEYWDLG